MKHYGIRLFLVLAAVLSAFLGWVWVGADGNLRNTAWQAPAPLAPDLGGEAVHLPAPKSEDASMFMATLDRPLFSPSRRPAPPAPKEGDAKTAPDPLASLHLYGLYTTEQGSSGMLARVDGQVRRIGVNEVLGGWTLHSVREREREVTLTRDGEERVISLAISRPPQPGKAPAAGAASAASVSAGTVAPSSAAGAAVDRRQEMQEAQRERLRRRNELRAKAGAQPISP